MASLAQINVLFRADLDQFSTEMQKTRREFEKTGKKMQEIGKQMSAYITAPLVALGGFSSKISMEFDDSMRKVMATTNATEAEFKSLTATAEEMGAKTRYTASQSAEAMNYMALAGWKSQQIIEGIPGVLALAAASGEDLGRVADILTDGLTAMGKGAEQASQFVDVLAASASNSNTTVGMMGQAFQYAAPLAGAFGYEVEDLALAIGLMANAGIKGEKAGTALRSLMTRMVKPTREAQKAMTDLGIVVKNSDGSMKPLGDVIDQIRTKFGKLTDAQKGQYAGMLAGQEAISGLLAIVNAAPADFDKLSKAVANSAGTAKRMSDQMEGGIGGSWREMQSALEGVAIQIGKVLEPALRKITIVIKDLSNWFMGLSDVTKKAIVVIGGLAAAIGPVLLALGTLVKILPVISAGYGVLTAAVRANSAAMLANPITAVVLALTTLTATLMLAETSFLSLTDATKEYNDVQNEAVKSISNEVVQFERLLAIAKNEKESLENRKKAIEELKRLKYYEDLELETINTGKADTAAKDYIETLKKQAIVKASIKKLDEVEERLQDLKNSAVDSIKIDWWQWLKAQNKAFSDILRGSSYDVSEWYISMAKQENKLAETKGLEELRNKLLANIESAELLNDLLSETETTTKTGTSTGTGDGTGENKFKKGTEGYYEAETQALEALRKATADSTEEYDKFSKKIEELQKKLKELRGEREAATAISIEDYTPVIEGSTVALERQIGVLQKLADKRKQTFGEADIAYQSLKNSIKDIEFEIKVKVDESGLSTVSNYIDHSTQKLKEHGQQSSDMVVKSKEESAEYAQVVGDVFGAMGSSISSAMGQSGDALTQFGGKLAEIGLKSMAIAMSQSAADSVVVATNSAKLMGPVGVYALPALISAAMGFVMAAHSKVPKFADGGIVSGPTFGLMGEYAGAANNPEVIAPLNKLKDLIEPVNSGGGITQITLGGGFTLRGNDLQLVLDRNKTRSKRIG